MFGNYGKFNADIRKFSRGAQVNRVFILTVP